jgi:hypothetical protein
MNTLVRRSRIICEIETASTDSACSSANDQRARSSAAPSNSPG